jgi:Fe2+ or Zn2+ uptake regulation protein
VIEHKILAQADDCSTVDNKNSLTATLLVDDQAIKSHSHVQCLDTGKILEVQFNFPKSLIEQAIKEVEQETGIQIVEYRFDLLGYQNFRTR